MGDLLTSSLGCLGLGGDPTDGAVIAKSESDTAPRLVYNSNTTAVYRLRDRGIKVSLANNTFSEQELIRKLIHELNVSKSLPPSCRKRQVIDMTSFRRRPALTFQWASGTTLKEWLLVNCHNQDADLSMRLRTAMAITETLSSFHDGGVVYNSLSSENIVLLIDQGSLVATFIDLSSAYICKGDKDSEKHGMMRSADMYNLGLVLNQLFEGHETKTVVTDAVADALACYNESTDGGGGVEFLRQKKREKQHVIGEGLPIYLGSIISTLTRPPSFEQSYQSAKDVLLDLRTMAGNLENSSFTKSHLDKCMVNSRLRLQENMFYGRAVEMSMLLHLFETCVTLGKQPLMAMISGPPGSGKSTLVNQIKKPLIKKNGFFIEGKFDKNGSPDIALISALDSFFGDINNTNAGNANISMKWRIHDAIGSESNSVLLEILPNFRIWLGDANGNTEVLVTNRPSVKGMGSSYRLKFMLCKLIGAIACKDHPLVLVLDDLQWSDEMTLDVIRMIMTDPSIQHFLFLGCYRDTEVCAAHPLMETFNTIQNQVRGLGSVTVKLGSIEQESVNDLIRDALSLPTSLCRPLAKVIHNKCGGIIMFILSFLHSLSDEGLLYFSMSSRRWLYDLTKISEKEIPHGVVPLMTQRMAHLPKNMQTGLKIAACLGRKFDAKLLQRARRDNDFEESFLESCVELGFLRGVGSKQYVWAHDQIQQAAYDLIPTQIQEAFHLLVATRLFMRTQQSEMEEAIFFIVDNMNKGSNLIDDQKQRYELSQMNLRAGEKAISSSAFHSAAKYFLAGISNLCPDSWDVEYDLTLQLYDAASEALYVTGDFSRLESLAETPLARARSFEEKLNIYHNIVRSQAASLTFGEGIAKCIFILENLGEAIPTNITAEVYYEEVAQVKILLQGKSPAYLLSLPIMTDTRQLAAMQFMNHALTMSYIAKPLLNPILVFRMVKMSILHGICNISAFAFGCYGAWLVSEPVCDIEAGYMMGQLGVEMMKRLDAIEMIPRLYMVVYGFINIWKEPWQALLGKHLEAFESGITTGDIEYAVGALYQYANTAIYGCGENLQSLSQVLGVYSKRAFQLNQKVTWTSLVIMHQLTLDLMGIQENAFAPYSNEMTEEVCFESTLSNKEISFSRLICNKKKYVGFFKGEDDVAEKMYDLSQEFPILVTGRNLNNYVNTFIDGLIGFSFARRHSEDEAKWSSVGQEAIDLMRKWANIYERSFSNKLYLLEAEDAFCRGDDIKARARYQASIDTAKTHRFVHEGGLAEEKFARFLLHKNEYDEAMIHLTNAKKCYQSWGACALVQRVDNTIQCLNKH